MTRVAPVQVVCSGVVDREVMVTNLAGHSMKLTRDEDGSVEVAGVKLFMRDKMTTNGVIHVIGEWAGYQSFKRSRGFVHDCEKSSRTFV